ncbi:MAG: HisA/HisF-related TIM barrel protein [Planctomycetaceae bacterium]
MRIIPVIDIRNGVAVRAVAGERGRYQPVSSRLTDSIEPAEVLRALRQAFHCDTCYVADLDAIEGRPRNRCTLAEMARTGARLIVDAGVVSPEDAHELQDCGAGRIVLASESLPRLDQLRSFVELFGSKSLVFSIDLKHGQLRLADPQYSSTNPEVLIAHIVEAGIEQIIVLDLAAVGTGTGISTLSLCEQSKRCWPDLQIISGGGVHSGACLLKAQAAGLDGLLIASALHDGRLTVDDIAAVHTVGARDNM